MFFYWRNKEYFFYYQGEDIKRRQSTEGASTVQVKEPEQQRYLPEGRARGEPQVGQANNNRQNQEAQQMERWILVKLTWARRL